jgi:amicyanin
MRKYLPFVVVVVVIVAIAGIAVANKDDNKAANPAPAPAPTSNDTSNNNVSQNPPSSSQATSSKEVSIADMAFSPANITVKKGTTITWTNNDSVGHDVIADSGNGPNSQILQKGQTYSFTYDIAGTFSYHCGVHPSMKGKVTVTE